MSRQVTSKRDIRLWASDWSIVVDGLRFLDELFECGEDADAEQSVNMLDIPQSSLRNLGSGRVATEPVSIVKCGRRPAGMSSHRDRVHFDLGAVILGIDLARDVQIQERKLADVCRDSLFERMFLLADGGRIRDLII